ncbi:unnamed protein product [Chironomus riparius]|uniref:Uncharacterized protein n=1 Tax=Chironomus riparius TaxID=315576 RepID=A0A9N9RWB9_9DIPT|nr:unnamed protein product [Chironomus riparius]
MGLFRSRSKSKNRDSKSKTRDSKSKSRNRGSTPTTKTTKSLCCCKSPVSGTISSRCLQSTCSGRNRSCCRPTTPCRPCTPITCCRPTCSCVSCNCQKNKKVSSKNKESKKDVKCSRIGCSEKMPCVSCCRIGPEKTKHPAICKKCKLYECQCKVKKTKKSK